MISFRKSRLLAAVTLLAAAQSAIAQEWPYPRVPDDASLALIGESMQVNGMPVRVYQFATRRGFEDVVRVFASSVEGTPRRTKLPGGSARMAVGGRSGDYWLTIQLQETGGMTVGTWSATPQFRAGLQRKLARLPGFPPEAQVLHQVDSYDDGRRSQLVVGLDRAGLSAVAQRLETELRNAGFTKQPFVGRNWHGSDRYVATFSRSREELMVTLREEAAGTSITMNRLSAMEVVR
jgi:hypothetical protein